MNALPPNRRRFPRYRCNQKVCIRYRADGHDAMAFGRCTVVGKGGIGAQVGAELAIGHAVQLEITLPASPVPRRVKAEVRSRDGLNYGFQFLQLDPLTASNLDQLFRPEAVLEPAMQMA